MSVLMRVGLLLHMIFALSLRGEAAEYFVNKHGDDANNGASRETAFLNIQKGLDALIPGDTLTIGPGEYFESVRRDNLGSEDAETVIRAEIPGTVLLRGDVLAPAFDKMENYRFVYVADFDYDGEAQFVNELDTLTIFSRMPNIAELEFTPGVFHHDRVAGKLYISTSDARTSDEHKYSVSVLPTHGLYLSNARRVVIEGIAATGFNAARELPNRDFALNSTWGIFIANGKGCVIRNCCAYLNGQGIGMNSNAETSGDNVIERCTAWANVTHFGVGDRGGLTLIDPRRDVVRDSAAFLNGEYGINIRGGGRWGNDEKYKSLLIRNLAWGNGSADFKIKTGSPSVHSTVRCIGLGVFSNQTNPDHCLVGKEVNNPGGDTIVLSEEDNLDPQRDFADPDNRDYRLQAPSRFRNAGPDGNDRGPLPYEANVFYVKPDGSDDADGLSVDEAWKTLARAARNLRPGDTLYLLPGAYPGGLEFRAIGKEAEPVSLRGRGREAVVIDGPVRVTNSRSIDFQRLQFGGDVAVAGSDSIAFTNCRFAGPRTALAATAVDRLTVSHCAFDGFRRAGVALGNCSKARLSGNLYANRAGTALRLDSEDALEYSDYNGYANAAAAWEIGGRPHAMHELSETHDRHSRATVADVAAGGPLGRPLGVYRDEMPERTLHLTALPSIHSVSATTANVEWMTSLPPRASWPGAKRRRARMQQPSRSRTSARTA